MTKTEAKIIAKTITNEQLYEMIKLAKNSIVDWNVRSAVNKGLSKGCFWNLLAKYFDVDTDYNFLSKWNLVREFGDYLPANLRVAMKKKRPLGEFTHRDPDFTGWE